jgi:hypothetical protein
MSNDSREAIKERNKLGYAVAKFVGAVDALLARADECEFDDGLAEVAPSDYWAAVRSAGDEMTFRAEEFEAEYQRMKAAQSRHAAEREALVLDKKRLDLVANEYLTIESFSMPTPGGDDADVGWRALQHYEREPKPRIIAEVFKDDPRAAIDAAILALLDSGSQG